MEWLGKLVSSAFIFFSSIVGISHEPAAQPAVVPANAPHVVKTIEVVQGPVAAHDAKSIEARDVGAPEAAQRQQKQVAQDETRPRLLLKSIGFNLDYYDAKTGMAGDVKFTRLPLESNFGLIMADFGIQDP